MDMEMETVKEYRCRKGCNMVFYSEETRINHESFIFCPMVCFDDVPSPSQGSAEATLREITSLPPSNDFLEKSGLLSDPYEVIFDDVGEEVEVVTDKQQSTMMQQNYGSRTLQEIMNTSKTSNCQLQELDNVLGLKKYSKNTPAERDPCKVFSDIFPTLSTFPNSDQDFCIQEKCNQKTLWELNSEDSIGGLSLLDGNIGGTDLEDLCNLSLPQNLQTLVDFWSPEITKSLQDCTVSTSQDTFDDLKLESMSSSSLEPVILDMEESKWTPIVTDTNFQPSINQLLEIPNLVSFLTKDKADDSPAAVASAVPELSPSPQEPKRRRGRPKKNQSKPAEEKPNIILEDSKVKLFMTGAILPDRSSKQACMEKIRKSISEGSESGSSDQEYPSAGSRKRARKAPRKFELDPDYEEIGESSDSFSLTDNHIEDENQEKRKKNNEASKKSRIKRKELDKMMEEECKILQNRYNYLKDKEEKLEHAVATVMRCITSA